MIQVRRLQDLRRYIQEECDQLLLRKERLREEVADTVHGEGGDPLDCTLRTVATQAPCSLLGRTRGPSLAINSLAQAYKVVALAEQLWVFCMCLITSLLVLSYHWHGY